MVVLVGATVVDPVMPLVPVQPPDAAQAVAFWLDQDSTAVAPEVMVAGAAARVTVGAGPADVCAGTTVIDVAWQGVRSPAASLAHTSKLYCPGTTDVPVRSPLGLRIIPGGGAPAARSPD